MASRLQRFTESIGLKVTKDQLDHLQMLADREGKPLAEWCREALLASLKRPAVTLFERALMAELAATQNITVSMLYEMANGLQLDQTRVRRILDNYHSVKFRDADERLKRADEEAARSQTTASIALRRGGM
jgi:urocanate hydratase